MQIFHGIAVSPGVAIGEAFLVDSEGFRIPRRFIDREAVDDELVRVGEYCWIALHRIDIAEDL